jgi:hypothetical protein
LRICARLSHDLLKAFRDFLNVHVLGVEYPGYGPVPGNPCEGGVNRHTRAAFNFLTQKLRIPPQRIIVFGTRSHNVLSLDLK